MYRENSAPDFLRKALATKWIWSYVGALVVYIIISLVSSNSVTTLIVSATFASFFIMVGLGQMLVITVGAGNIDLSIPYTIGLSGLMAMKVMNGADGMIWLGILAGLGSGAVIGAFNFLLIRFVRIPPMIATLSSGFIIQTLAIVFFRGLQIKPPDGLQTFVNVKFGPIPLIFLVVIVIVYIMHLVITRSKYGRFIHAIGQNIRAASLAGINISANKLIVYMMSAAFASLTGILLAAFSGGATLGMGEDYLLNSIAVVVLGGSSIAGGDSNVQGIVGASVLLYLIVNLLNIIGFVVGLRYILTGVIIVAIILASGETARRK